MKRQSDRNTGTIYINPGCSWHNLCNESFNGVFPDGCINRWLFSSIRKAQELTDAWLYEYNHECPHGSLGGLKSAKFEQLHWQNSRIVIKKERPV